MLLTNYRECADKQKNGTPIYLNTPRGEVVFYLRRWGSLESDAVLKDLRRSLFGPLSKNSEEDAHELYAHWLVEYGIAGWDNLHDDSTGELIEYSKVSARTLFLDRSYFMSLNQKLINDALTFENYLVDEAEEMIDEIKKL